MSLRYMPALKFEKIASRVAKRFENYTDTGMLTQARRRTYSHAHEVLALEALLLHTHPLYHTEAKRRGGSINILGQF